MKFGNKSMVGDIQIVDNFLSSYESDNLIKTFDGKIDGYWASELFPWTFINDLNGEEYLGNYYFNKILMKNYEVPSKNASYWMPLFEPLIKRIGCRNIFRLKVNLYPRTHRRVHHSPHIDYESNSGLRTALYYVNTNNGFTFFDGTRSKVKSKENRIAFFDGSNKHHSTTPTDCNYRVTINVDYTL